MTLAIPGTAGSGAALAWLTLETTPGCRSSGGGAKLMTLLQFGLGQAILWEVFLQIRRQLHGQRTYLRPAGAFLMGVASVQTGHLTTCWSRLPEMSMGLPQTRHVTMGAPPDTEL